jgi:hypothetical protein
MPEFNVVPSEVSEQQEITPRKWNRSNWFSAGIDNFLQPPGQNQDKFLKLNNVLSPMTDTLKRRWGQSAFNPKLDAGANANDDQGGVQTAIKATNLYLYEDQTANKRTPIMCAGDGTGVLSSTNNVIYFDNTGTAQSIFTPSLTATAARMAYSRSYAYFTDGVAADETAWNINSGKSKWGITAPTNAISIAVSASANSSWTANTVFATMPLIVDTNNNIQFLTSINATGTNASLTLGSSGSGSPSWNQTPGNTTSDGSQTWTNKGPIALRVPSKFYSEGHFGFGTVANPAIVYDPVSNALYFNNQGGGGTSSSATTIGFTPGIGAITVDGTVRWEYLGSASSSSNQYTGGWKPSSFYPKYGGTNQFFNTAIVENTTIAQAYNTATNTFNQTLYLQSANTSANSSASFGTLSWATTTGAFTDDGNLRWVNLGSKTFVNGQTSTGWAIGSTSFSATLDTHGNMQVCITGGTSGGGTPAWPASYVVPTGYGVQTADGGTVVWSAVGPPIAWAALTQWFLPTSGYVPPASTTQYGGATIADTNSVLQAVVVTGKSQTPGPVAWQPVGSTTTDNTITWYGVVAIAPGSSAGNITLNVGRRYYAVFQNATKQNFSDLNTISGITGPVSNSSIYLFTIPVSSDTQVSNVVILGTADGGDPTTLYYVGTVANGVTTFSDNTPEISMLAGNIYQQIDSFGNEIGVVGNQPPPNGSFPTLHKGRVFLTIGQFLYYSKSLAEVTTSSGIIAGRYEEDWPLDNSLDCSPGAENIKGLLSDGYTLYIGTERHIKRLLGSSAADFGQPDTLFTETGILNQNTWQIVYREGAPIGSMWITPDFRVLYSDFNTYDNAGMKIQQTLNSINQNAAQASWAQFVGYGPYNYYALAIPTGSNTVPDTLCMFDLHSREWVTFQFNTPLYGGMFYVNLFGVPRWIVIDTNGIIKLVDTTQTNDLAVQSTNPNLLALDQTSTTSFPTNVNQFDLGTITPVQPNEIALVGCLTNGVFSMSNTGPTWTELFASVFTDIQTTTFTGVTPIHAIALPPSPPATGIGIYTSLFSSGGGLTQIAGQQASTAAASPNTSRTVNLPNPVSTSSGHCILAYYRDGLAQGTTPPTVTDNQGNTYVSIGGASLGIANFAFWIFMCQNPKVGTQNITFTISPQFGNGTVVAGEFQGIVSAAQTTTAPIVSTIQTVWLDLGDSSVRKVLNEIGYTTSDAAMLTTVEGATNSSQFNAPDTVITNVPITKNFYNDLKVMLAGYPTIDKYYRFTFTSTSGVNSLVTDNILAALSIENIPFNRI